MATVIYLTTGSGTNATFNVPADWNSANNTIEVIGGGGGGSSGNVAGNITGAGGGGAAYSILSNLNLTPSGTATYTVGLGGGIATTGGDSWFNGTSLGGSSVGSKGGGGASGATFGPGGLASGSVGTATDGGSGGVEANTVNGASGGGGAAGPGGVGAAGGASGASTTFSQNGGGGGGGNGGGVVGGTPIVDQFHGAPGGAAVDATAGGAGGNSNVAGGVGSQGSGGGGGGSTSTASAAGNGGVGGNGLDLGDGTKGSGGGGGGGGGRDGAGSGTGGTGGAGGLYGAGGGGGGWTTTTAGLGGVGADGLIVITYTPAGAAASAGPSAARWKRGYRIPVWSTTSPTPVFFSPIAATATPSAMSELAIGEDLPRRRDYSRVLESTTHPVAGSIVAIAQTPAQMGNFVEGEDNPRRPDYRTALAATTRPVGISVPPPPAQTPDFQFELTVQEDNPRRRDYSRVLESTTHPVGPIFISAAVATPSAMADLALQEDVPRRRDYRTALAATTSPVGPKFFCFNMLQNPGFETGVQTPWVQDGDVSTGGTGVDNNPAHSHSGTDSAYIFTNGGTGYVALRQTVTVAPFSDYVFSGWVAAFGTGGTGIFDIANAANNSSLAQAILVDSPNTPPAASDYNFYIVQFNSGANGTVNVQVGYIPPGGGASINIDDLSVVPFACATGLVPTPDNLPDLIIQEDIPRRRDYRQALAATTRPAAPIFVPAVTATPSVMSNLALQEDLPRRRNYQASLASTSAFAAPIFIPAAPVATPSAMGNLIVQEDLPRRRDYRAALSPNTSPILRFNPCPDIAQFVWDGSLWDCAIWAGSQTQFPTITIGRDRIARDYRVPLASTTSPVGGPHGVLPVPTVTPSVMGDLTIQEDRPRRKDYRVTLTATPVVVFNPCADLVQNDGFESGSLSPWWLTDGDVSSGGSGVDTSAAHAKFGNDSGYVYTTVAHTAYVALRQPVAVAPGKNYTASAWVNMFNTGGSGCFTVTNGANDTDIVTMGIPDTGTSPPSAAGYTRFSIPFNSGSETTVNIQVGYFAIVASGGAIGATRLDSGMDITVASSYLTAVVAPVANRLTIVAVASNAGSGNTLPTVTGAGGTWVQVATSLDAGSIRRTTLFRDLSASPGSGQLTIDFAGNNQTNCGWSVTSFSNVNTSGSNGSGAIVQNTTGTSAGTTTGLALTLGAFTSPNNASFGFIRNNTTGAITAGSGFTELSQDTNFTTVEAEWKPNSTTVDWTWASQSVTSVAIAIEIAASNVASSSFNLDDVSIVPAACDPIIPPWFNLAVGEDRPRRRNFQTVLDTRPVGPKLLPTITPTTLFMVKLVLGEDMPRRPNYRVALASTTSPVGPALIATVTPAPVFDLITQEDNPRRADYRGVLASTAYPVGPELLPTPTPDTRADVVTPGPQARDYSRALEATTHPVGQLVGFVPIQVSAGIAFATVEEDMPRRRDYSRVLAAPAVIRFPMRPPQCAKWDEGNWDYDFWCDANAATPVAMASVITPEPQKRDYSRALESTTHPVGQLYGATVVVAAPGVGFFPPSQPLPGRRDYRTALQSTTRPRTSHIFPPEALTPTRWFGSPYPSLPGRRDYSTVLASTSDIAYTIRELPFVPPEPPVEVCVVPLPGGGGSAVVILPAGTAPGTVTLAGATGSVVALTATAVPGVVSLTGSTQGVVPLDPNLECP